MKEIIQALLQGIDSQFQPRMLALLVLPFVVSLLGWAVSAWLLWEPVTTWLQGWFFTPGGWMASALDRVGLGVLGTVIPDVFAVLVLLPLVLITALVTIALVSMPAVLAFVGQRHYPDVQRRGDRVALAASLWNVARSLAIFIPGYLICIPLWFIPPLALVVPLLWWGWLTARLLRFDSSAEHADRTERRWLLKRHRRAYWVLGVALAALNTIPPLFLVVPVLSALVFAHYSLARLRALRHSGGVALPHAGYPVSHGGSRPPHPPLQY